ncbi:response regulator [Bacillus cereus group sp. MYBK79-1]|uniref:response regulator n=1 Tax=unclassified Bacillus cereus group TaxID=2750818 RepID=UPI003F7B07E4
MKIKGLYIEDELDNIESYGRFFTDEGIELQGMELLESPDQYYDWICKENIDFVIIDNHLDKMGVKYDGFDVLEKIREQDSYIYILLLTNFQFNDKDKKLLGEFDQTILKKEFLTKFDEVISRIKRAHKRRISNETATHIKIGIERREVQVGEHLKLLRGLNEKLENIISIKPKG